MRFSLRKFQHSPRQFIAILSQNPHEQLDLVDAKGRVLFCVALPTHMYKKRPPSVDTTDLRDVDNILYDRPHFTPTDY